MTPGITVTDYFDKFVNVTLDKPDQESRRLFNSQLLDRLRPARSGIRGRGAAAAFFQEPWESG